MGEGGLEKSVCHREGTVDNLSREQRQKLAMAFDAFKAVVFRIGQSNVQNHLLRAQWALNLHAIL
jgi:hypothetical protein